VQVDRCVCHDVPFSELIRLAETEGLSLDDLERRTGCCTGCGMCEAYVRLALATGEASLPVIAPEEAERRIRLAKERGGASSVDD